MGRSWSSTWWLINVMVVGRKEIIKSPNYHDRHEAEADLRKITEARTNAADVDLPWLQMPGGQVQAAYIDEKSSSIAIA